METRTNALVLTVIVAILLIIAIRFKIRSDKKAKSILIASKRKNEKLFWRSSPVLALYALLGGFVVLFAIPEDWVNVEAETSMALLFLTWGAVNAICCFFIVRQNPKSIWYVPLIIDVFITYAAITETDSWGSIILISLCGAWLLSIIASIIGALMGRRKAISDNP